MTPEQFALWFQGFAELTPEPPSAAQWQLMREHVATVFTKVTPPLGYPRDDLKRELRDILRPVITRERPVSRDRIIC